MITLNGVPINVTKFPDGTSQVWKLDKNSLKKDSLIVWEFENETEIMHYVQLKSLLKEIGIQFKTFIPYLPYGRQDKDINNDSTFALSCFGNLLSDEGIYILDPHSDKVHEYVGNIEFLYPYRQIKTLASKYDLVCYPDKGAYNKYTKVYNKLENIIHADKVRNQSTGIIENVSLSGECTDKKVFIIDDICDGGTTFILLTKELYKAGAKEVGLYTTHGIYSKGLKDLKEVGIKNIFNYKGEVFYSKEYDILLKPFDNNLKFNIKECL